MAVREIKAMMPGVFYRKPSPDQPPFKNEGDSVNKGEVIGLIEVMKSFHEVVSDHDGKLVAFKVENEGTIAPGQTIAEVEE